MGDVVDFEPVWFYDRASFQAILDEHYPDCSPSSSTMQLDEGLSSPGTSSPGVCTPPSSTDTQEDAHSPDVTNDTQTIIQHASSSDILGHMGPSTMDLTGMESSQLPGDIEMPDQTAQGLYGNVAAHQYMLYQLSRQSPFPNYVWGNPPEGFPQEGVGFDPTMMGFEEPNSFQNPSATPWTSPQQMSISPGTYGMTSPLDAFSSPRYTASTVLFNQDNLAQESPPLANYSDTLAYRISSIGASMSEERPPSSYRATATKTTELPRESAIIRSSPDRCNTSSKVTKQSRPTLRAAPPSSSRSADETTSPVEPSGSQSPRSVNRGGRRHGLDIETRERANEMRKIGVCWICAIARDKCDPGQPCGRCAFRSQRGQPHLLGCLRIHLQELVIKFLPTTMNRQHRRDETVAFVQQNLGYWRASPPLQVCLTSHGLGYFTWDLHEFEPSSQEILFQRRYLIGTNGKWQALQKRSPPLALREVNYAQTHKLETYVENILDKCLDRFRKECYEEEGQYTALFQGEILGALCDLYTALPEEESDKNLKGDLRQVLKMIVLTYIMDHAVTIFPTYQTNVISKMQNYNDPTTYQDWTSPMMANRQFKYFFSEMQTHQYTKSLNRLHQILRTANNKGKQWMSSFVLILGIGLVLEQCQHLLWIKAENKVAKFECDANEAEWQARRDCATIDDSFDFLCNLYHCKYRGRHRQKTRFEEWSSQTSNAAEAEFTGRVYDIVDRNGGYLLQRKSLEPTGMADNDFSSRLTARFLVDLMGLDRSSP